MLAKSARRLFNYRRDPDQSYIRAWYAIRIDGKPVVSICYYDYTRFCVTIYRIWIASRDTTVRVDLPDADWLMILKFWGAV